MTPVKQAEVSAGLVLMRSDPLNCETSISALVGGEVMPASHFYIRNHFPIPGLEADDWRLNVTGLVTRPLTLSLRDLLDLPSQAMTVTLECAGNGRSKLAPAVEGEQWGLGAVSTAEWAGVRLFDVLDRAGVERGVREVLFRGADCPRNPESGGRPFERSLSLDDARSSQPLLAYAMNGDALPLEHGYPLRLIVPGWYAVTAVKWLTDIELIGHAFTGHFQTEKYVYEREQDGVLVKEPVRIQRVRALITRPGAGDTLSGGDVAIRGVAWSGAAAIARVDVSVGGGPWREARLLGDAHRYGWRRWELMSRFGRPGFTTIRARATDRAGRRQPERAEWNRLGYGNNAIQEIRVRVD
jgi:DMSO/TMAO reductase YedYZ molybdopterin-dependent catalytic subunit